MANPIPKILDAAIKIKTFLWNVFRRAKNLHPAIFKESIIIGAS